MAVETAEDLLALSDEELLELSPDKVQAISAAEAQAQEAPQEEEQEASDPELEPESEEEETVDKAEEQEPEEEIEEDDDPSDEEIEGLVEDSEESLAEGQEDDDEAVDEVVEEKEETPQDVPEGSKKQFEDGKTEDVAAEPKKDNIDYKAAYERLLAPFKANGKDMQVESVDDAITLMQMGANYNKKMAALKPNLKLLKMLENNDLLNTDKLSYLIDLDKKDPAAIQKLVKESGIDLLDIDQEQSEYKPGTYTVDDREVDLDQVLDKIQDTPTYQRTIDIVSTKWDGPSKQAVANAPALLEVINDHVASGIYDVINTAVERERMLGRLDGLSDFDAYKQIGEYLNNNGGFDHLNQSKTDSTPEAPRREVKPKAKSDPVRSNKRRAASPTKSSKTPVETRDPDFNPLSMSDEEFEKQVSTRLL